jgi:hypothetical protein
VLADLVPNASYFIARNGVSIGTGTASRGGVLIFRTSKGGLFTVRTRAGARTRLPERGDRPAR